MDNANTSVDSSCTASPASFVMHDRDYFALLTFLGLIRGENFATYLRLLGAQATAKTLARFAYWTADAMVAERQATATAALPSTAQAPANEPSPSSSPSQEQAPANVPNI